MKHWTPQQAADAAGAELLASGPSAGGPERVSIDSRDVAPGVLFVGLPGSNVDGGTFAQRALQDGAWGVLTAPKHAPAHPQGTWLTAGDPLQAMQAMATAWRRELGAKVIGVTGSTGKTSTKDLLRAVLAPQRRVVASRANFNTEIGLPLELLAAPEGTEVLVLEMGMRGPGQIAELASIAEPDVAVIVSIGPVHVELLGGLEQIAAAKAELIASLAPGATAVVPAGEPLLTPHLRTDIEIVTFGDRGDIRLIASDGTRLEIDDRGDQINLAVAFTQAHLRRNLLAAVGAARAVGVTPDGRVELELSPGRGQRVALQDGITLIDDCYNANPMSMQAALDDLATTAVDIEARRRVAVLGDMLELGPEEHGYHVELGRQAERAGVDLIITVGPLAAAIADGYHGATHETANAAEAARLVPKVLHPGDIVLVKASNGVGLRAVCQTLTHGAAA